MLDPVGPDDLRERVAVRAGAELQVRAVVVDARDAQRLERAVVVERERGVVVAVGAAVVVVDDVRRCGPRRTSPGRPTSIERKPAKHGTLCMKNFEPKLPPAATGHERGACSPGSSAYAAIQPQEVREVHRVAVDRDDAGAAVVVADRAVRVHRHRRSSAASSSSACTVRSASRERPVDLAERERALVGDVRPQRLVHERRALLARRERVEHDGQLLVVDLDQVAGVLGDVAVLGDHGRDGLAVVAHLLDRDHVLDDRAGAERRQRRRVLGDVLAGDDANDAGQRLGRRRVDRDDLRVRVRAAHDRRVRHAGQLDVVEVAALAAQEARVLDAVDALAEPAARARLRRRRCRGRPWRRSDPARSSRCSSTLRTACDAAWIDSTICW